MKITYKNLIGKVMLVGITYNDSDGNVKERKQFGVRSLRRTKAEFLSNRKTVRYSRCRPT